MPEVHDPWSVNLRMCLQVMFVVSSKRMYTGMHVGLELSRTRYILYHILAIQLHIDYASHTPMA